MMACSVPVPCMFVVRKHWTATMFAQQTVITPVASNGQSNNQDSRLCTASTA